MSLRATAVSDVGQRRQRNEDSFHCSPELGLFVVCDGMGGHASGHIASSSAVAVLVERISADIDELRRLAGGGRETRRLVLESLRDHVLAANNSLYTRSQEDPELRGMGTTMSLLLIVDDAGFVAHVGDSRLYLVRNQQVHQITSDHTVFQELLRAGRVKEEDRKKNPSLGALTRAVGVYPTVQVDTLDIDLLPKDLFLLCSDGLHAYLEDFDLVKFLQHTESAVYAAELVEYANRRGGLDNITALTVGVARENDTFQTMRMRLTLRTLRSLSLFHHLSYSELLQVIPLCEPLEVPAGHTLMREGELGDAMYVVIEGEVTVHRGDAEVARLGAGRHVGEMALVDNRPRSASVTASTASNIIRLERTAFFELLRADPVLAVKLLWNIIQSLSAMVRTSNDEQYATPDLSGQLLDPFTVGKATERLG